jgi:hypothetical protein
MSVSRVKDKSTAPKQQPNLLDQIGKAWNDLMGGKKTAGKPKVQVRNTSDVRDKSAVPGKSNVNKSKPSPATAPRIETPRPVQVVHKFDGKDFQKSESMGGLFKTPDRTHQVVQQQDKKGVWQVHIQPVESGRRNPNQHSFSSNRPVTVKDFNDTNSTLSRNSVAAAKRLNADSNRLPDAPAPVTAKKPDEPKLSTGDWAKQQAANLAGGVSSSFTSTVGYVTSLPELTRKTAQGPIQMGKMLGNSLTGGQLFKSAYNPIVNDRVIRDIQSKPLTEQWAAAGQGKIDSAIGANSQSLTYKGAELVAPFLLTKKGGGKPTTGEMVRTGTSGRSSGRTSGGGGSPKPQAHPVEGLKDAVRLHKEGKINDAKLNEAMARANSEFKAQKGPDTPSWSAKMRKDFISHSGEANSALSGAQRAPSPSPTAAKPPTKPVRASTNAGASNTPTTPTELKPASRTKSSNPSASTSAPLQPQGQRLQGTTSSGKPVTLKSVNPSVIKPVSKHSRAAVVESKTVKNADGSLQSTKANEKPAGKTASQSNVLASIERRPGETMHDFLTRNGVKPSLTAAQEAAADKAGLRMSATPDKPLDVSKWNLPMGEVVLGKKPAIDPALDMSKLNQGAFGKRPPSATALDVSKWNLPMGEVVFGKQAVPGPVLPGLEANFAKKGGALVSQQIADPRTGQIIRIGPNGKLSVNDPLAPKNITAQTPVRPEIELPAVKALEAAGFNRGGPRFTLKFLDHQATVDVWYQKPKSTSSKTEATPDEVKPNINKVVRQIMTDVVANAGRIRNTEDFGEFVAKNLNEKLPKSVGWALKITPPPASVGSGEVGANLGSYIEIGNLQSAISSGAVLYDPNARMGRRYSLNTQVNAEGNTVMAKPLEITVGKRLGISPFSIPNIPKIPMPWGTSVGVSFGQSKEIKVPLAGEVNESLLRSINKGLNNAMSMQMWHDAGADGYRQVRQVNFSVPLAHAREGSYELPRGWPNIHDRLVPESKRDNDAKWSSYTSAIANWGSPELFGLSVKGGIRYERVEPVKSEPAGPTRIRYSSSLERRPDAQLSTEPLSAEPFTFMSHKEGSPLIEVIPSDVTRFRDNGARVLPEVKGTLLGGRQANVPMPGSVLNALNNYPVSSRDIGPIIEFVQSLKPKGATRREADAHVYQLVKDHPMGQPLSAEKQANLRAFIHWYTTYETPPRFGSFGSIRR